MKALGYFCSLFFFLHISVKADEVKLHLLRSPLGIDWSTPWKLTNSVLLNQVAPVGDKRRYSISHVFIELKCDSLGVHLLRGMTSATDTEERELLFKKGYGLGIMFHTYQGKLEKNASILKDLAPYKGSKRRAELAIKISSSTCQRLVEYAREYEELGYGQMYSGLQADPLKREGAGCSAFAVSFLRVGGLMDKFTNEWKKIIDVPKSLIGGPITGGKVHLGTLLTRPFARWNSKVSHVHLEAWDPEAMHSWVKKTYLQVINGNYNGKWPANVNREKDSYQVELNMEERETPAGEFWL
jgi:hypothetical protein